MALLAAMVAASDSRLISHEPQQADPKAAFAQADRDAEKSLGAGKAEARQWLDEKYARHVVWKWNKTAARKAVNDLYAAGANDVSIVAISKTEGGIELASQLIITLPAQQPARRQVFGWIAC